MNRRDFFKKLAVGIGVAAVTPSVLALTEPQVHISEIGTWPGNLTLADLPPIPDSAFVDTPFLSKLRQPIHWTVTEDPEYSFMWGEK